MTKNTTSGFSRWLFRRRHEQSPIGDLANDAHFDNDWPRNGTTRDEFMAIVGTTDARDAFVEAWEEWTTRVSGSLSTPEPEPTTGTGRSIHDTVIDDMVERKAFGLKKYGTELQAHNGRDALVDAYQEALDLVVYLRQEIAERPKNQTRPKSHKHITKAIADLKTAYEDLATWDTDMVSCKWRLDRALLKLGDGPWDAHSRKVSGAETDYAAAVSRAYKAKARVIIATAKFHMATTGDPNP